MKADQLLRYKPFSVDEVVKAKLFKEALTETLARHYEGSEVYSNYCKKNNFDPNHHFNCLEDVPYIPIQLFKANSLLTVKEDEIIDIRKSSSTSTGTPSVVYRDRITLERYRLSRNLVFDDYIDDRNTVHICVGENPASDSGSSRNLVNTLIAERSGTEKTYFVINDKSDKFKVDLYLFLDIFRQAEQNQKTIGMIYGGTAIIYLYLIMPLLEKNVKLNFTGYVAHGGGWKKLKDRQIPEEIFINKIKEVFNCPEDRIVDMYGFAESNSIFLDCQAGFKHAPLWNEVIIRDPVNMKPVKKGEVGIVQILDVLPNSYAAASLLTDDIGYISQQEKCPCGRNGTAFKIVRRATGSEAKGCGDMMVERMKIC